MGRTAGATNLAANRLPVNHRRHKVPPEQRKRVATACNSCNVRRIKCSGEKPCLQCKNGTRECEYPAPIEKVVVPRTDLDNLRSRCEQLEQCLEQVVPDRKKRHELVARAALNQQSTYQASSNGTIARPMETQDDEHDQNDGRWLADPDGQSRYLGSTSGATFLDLVKEFMMTIFPLAWPNVQGSGGDFLASLGKYQTGDSRPIEEPDVEPTFPPTKHEVTEMLRHLRTFVQDGATGDFASGGIYYWADLDLPAFDTMASSNSTDPRFFRRLALFHAAFALNSQLELPSKDEVGEQHFARAKKLLGNPLDTTNNDCTDIPVLTMMALYLIEMNRRDAAYLFISWGVHIAVVHGVHIGGWHNEQGRRAFWTLYILDKWLSCLMGRPPCLVDDAIKLPPPQDARGLPPCQGLKAHVELMKICGYIVCNTYRIAPSEFQNMSTSQQIDRALLSLSRWKEELPPELMLSESSFSYDRATCELHMFHNQLFILTVRPIFFVAVKKAVGGRYIDRQWNLKSHAQYRHIRGCVDTARRNIKLGRWVREISPSKKLLSQDLHHIFNAAIVLLLNQLLDDNLEPEDLYDVLFVVNVFKAESCGDMREYPKDCARVLQDLTALIRRLRNESLEDQGLYDFAGQSSLAATSSAASQQQQQQQQPQVIVSPGSSTSQPQQAQQPVPQQPMAQQHHINHAADPNGAGGGGGGGVNVSGGGAVNPVTTAYDVGYILNPDIPPNLLTAHPQLGWSNNALYNEMTAWMEYDDYQLYNHRLG